MDTGYSMRLLVAATALALATSVVAQPIVKNGVFTNEQGLSLYVWDNDLPTPGKSACEGGCAMTHIPLIAKADAKASGDFSLIARADGAKQWAYKGRPLYRWVDDKKPGDAKADGFRGNTWHLARP